MGKVVQCRGAKLWVEQLRFLSGLWMLYRDSILNLVHLLAVEQVFKSGLY